MYSRTNSLQYGSISRLLRYFDAIDQALVQTPRKWLVINPPQVLGGVFLTNCICTEKSWKRGWFHKSLSEKEVWRGNLTLWIVIWWKFLQLWDWNFPVIRYTKFTAWEKWKEVQTSCCRWAWWWSSSSPPQGSNHRLLLLWLSWLWLNWAATAKVQPAIKNAAY